MGYLENDMKISLVVKFALGGVDFCFFQLRRTTSKEKEGRQQPKAAKLKTEYLGQLSAVSPQEISALKKENMESYLCQSEQ